MLLPALSTCFFNSSIVVIFLRAHAHDQIAGLNAPAQCDRPVLDETVVTEVFL